MSFVFPLLSRRIKLADLKYVLALKETLLQHAKAGALIILESTVGVADTRRVLKDMVRN